jgi:hypothetical protein
MGGDEQMVNTKLDSKTINSKVKPAPTTAHGSVKCVLALQLSALILGN